MVLLDTPFSFYIKTSRARLPLSTSYFEVKVVSLLFRHTLRVHMPAADRHLHSTSYNLSRRLSSARDASPPLRALGRRKHLLMVAAPVRAHSLCALTLSPQSVAVHALARFGCEPTIACRVPRRVKAARPCPGSAPQPSTLSLLLLLHASLNASLSTSPRAVCPKAFTPRARCRGHLSDTHSCASLVLTSR